MSSPIQIGDFRIERQIGAGGMGIVYLARQVSLDRLVALKVLGQSLTRENDMARFQREAQAVAKLNHSNIASVHFVGQDNRLCYMAMEYVDGVSLRECIERLSRTTKPDSSVDDYVDSPTPEPSIVRFDSPAPTMDYEPTESINPYRSPQAEQAITTPGHFRRCAQIARDVAKALQHAHDKGVVHRDLKPDNLMLGKDGQVHIIDFGVARFFEDATLTQTGALVGTPIYMSPEQVTGRIDLDQRTDIYSLGITLYELLVLRQPITSTSRDGVLRKIVVKPLQPVSQLNESVPESLQNIVHKATAKDPDDRYQAAQEVADDLDRFIAGEDVLALPYQYRTDESEIMAQRPWIVLVTSSATMFLGLMSLLSFIVWGSYTYASYVIGEREMDQRFYFRIAENLAYFAVSLASFPIAWGFWSARTWARIALSIGGFGIAAWFVVLNRMRETRYSMHEYEYIEYVFFACVLALVPLVDGKTRKWFKLARQVRREEATGAR